MLELQSITKSHNNQIILDNLSIKIDGALMLGIFGKSGSGKTTLLNIIGGIDDQYDGVVLFNGVDIKTNKNVYLSKYVGTLMQNPNLLNRWNLKDNLNLFHLITGFKTNVCNYFEKLDISLKNKNVNKLSGGESTRVSLIRILNKQPSILLCDEPTSALDQVNAERLMDVLKLESENKIVIVISHDVELLQKYCDYTLELKDGKLSQKSIETNKDITMLNKPKRRNVYGAMKVVVNSIIHRKERSIMTMLAIMIATISFLLTILFAFNLQATLADEINKILPQNYISVRKVNGEPIIREEIDDLLKNDYIEGAYLNLKGIELQGIAREENGDYLFIGDSTRVVTSETKISSGRLPISDDEILLSINTYNRMFGDEFKEEVVYALYNVENKMINVALTIVGIADEYTSFDAIYGNSLHEFNTLENKLNMELVGDYLLLKSSQDIDVNIEKLSSEIKMFEFKKFGSVFNANTTTIINNITKALFIISAIVLVAIALLISMSVYLSQVEKQREYGIFKMMGATTGWIRIVQVLEVILVSLIGTFIGIMFFDMVISSLNSVISYQFGLDINMTIESHYYIILYIVILFASLLASIVSIIQFTGKNIIDSIKGGIF